MEYKSTDRASPWVVAHAHLIPAAATVLDVAAGSGRHARLFRTRQHPVVAVDRDIGGLTGGDNDPQLEIIEADLEGSPSPFEAGGPLHGRSFGGVVVVNYLWRPIMRDIIAAVSEYGILIYETFAQGNERFGKPANPNYLLRPGELIEAVQGELQIVRYEQVEEVVPRLAVRQRIVATRRKHPVRA